MTTRSVPVRSRTKGAQDERALRTVQWLWASAMAGSLGVRLSGLLNVGAPMAVLTVPSVVRRIRAHRADRWPQLILGLYAAVVLLMPLMTVIGLLADPQRVFSAGEFAKDVLRICSLGLVICGIFWACTRARAEWVMSMVATGIAARYLLFPDVPADELFKFRLGPTLPFIVLALAARAPRAVQVVALAVVALMSAYFNLRASLVAAAVAAIALAISMVIPRFTRRRKQTLGTTVVAIALTGLSLGVGAFTVPQLAEDGYFGSEIQRRQISQETSDEGVFGARIEPGASLALAQDRPMGLGPGVMPSEHDRQTAWGGLLRLGVDPAGGGFNAEYMREMMQGRIFLHSSLAESWWHYGVPGAAFIIVIGAFMGYRVIEQLTRTDPYLCGLVLYVAIRSMWDSLFEPVVPIGTNLMVATGFLLWLHIERASGRAISAPPDPGGRTSGPTSRLPRRTAPPRRGWRDA